jgi:hypothetical protein
VPGTSTITVESAGDYLVNFSVSGTEPGQFGLTVNGDPVPSTIYGSGAGTQQDNGEAIVALGAGDTLTIRNRSSASAIGLASGIGGTQANVNASVILNRLG